MNDLNCKKSSQAVAKATKRVDRALKQYGEPTMTSDDLRAAIDEKLHEVSLRELILRDRQKEL